MTAGPLIHIGYHRTGTTWLQNRIFVDPAFGFVRQQPMESAVEAFVTVDRDAFDPEAAGRRFGPLIEGAAQSGLVPVLSHERLSMGAATGTSRDIADRLAAAFPSGRVLAVIREQRSIMISIYKGNVRRSGADSFRRFWERPFADDRGSLRHFEYHLLIAHYRQVYGSDRVLVLPFELLRADPVAFVASISTFVGNPVPTDVPHERENVGMNAAATSALRYVDVALRTLRLGSVFEGNAMRRMRQRVTARVGTSSGKRSRRIEADWRAIAADLAGERFSNSNRITSELTGLDLGGLGYL